MTLRHPEARHVTNRVVNEYLEPLLSPTEQRLPRKVWGCRVRADHGACSLRATGPIVTCQGRIKIVELPDEYRVWAARLRCD
jgi:hypothetical protein